MIIKIKYKNQIVETLIDSEDWKWIKEFKLNVRPHHRGYFYIDATHPSINRYKHREKLHRLIWMKHFGDINEFIQIDHKDRNTLNNQKSNLRTATGTQNRGNQGSLRNNTSGYKGVWFNKRLNKYCAEVNLNGRKFFRALFDNLEDAAIAYDIKAKEAFGEFAYLNFPEINIDDLQRVSQIIKKSENKTYHSQFRGVSKDCLGYWRAEITHNKKRYFLGTFPSEVEAAQAYNQKAIELRGDKAKLNIVSNG